MNELALIAGQIMHEILTPTLRYHGWYLVGRMSSLSDIGDDNAYTVLYYVSKIARNLIRSRP